MTNINDYIIKMPQYEGETLPDEIELKSHALFLSPPGCCAQTTLPYWAKVTGNIKNNSERELLLLVSVHLGDEDCTIVGTYSDIIAIDEKGQGTFDVKLVEYNKNINKNFVEIKEIDEDEI